jgi:transposase InsO family protein
VGTAFYAVGLVLLPTLAFTGLVTFERVLQSGIEDLGYARRIALLRGHYFDEAPELIPYLLSVPEQRQADLPHPPLHAAVKQPVWATLQRELRWIHRSRTWATRDQLRCALFGYVECFYNPVRIQERLGYRSPADYEQVSVA